MELLFNNIQRFVPLTDKDKKLIAEKFRSKKIKKKQLLLSDGEVCKYNYFIIKGCMRKYYIDKNGFEHIMAFAVEDWWITDLYSFYTDIPSIYNIDALEDSEIIYIDKDSIETLYKELPKMERYFRILLQNAHIAQQQRIMGINSFTAEDRFVSFREKYPQFEKRISQKYVASFLGITPEFLSRLKKQLLKH